MIGFIIGFLVIGLVAGAIARLILPGRDRLGCLGTLVLGLVGSFIGGFLGYVIFGHDFTEGPVQPSGIVGSIIGSVVALLLYRSVKGRVPKD